MLGRYLFNKIAVGFNTASEMDAGSHDHVTVHGDEYLGVGGQHAGLDAIGMSVCMYVYEIRSRSNSISD